MVITMKKSFSYYIILCFQLVAASNQAADSSFVFYVYGDSRSGHSVHRQILETMRQKDFAFIASMGDLVDNASQDQWDVFNEIIVPMGDLTGNSHTYLSAVGDHDVHESGYIHENWHKNVFWLPGNGEFYKYDYKNVRFIFLDSNYEELNEQCDSLKIWLQTNDPKWTFAAWHHPSYPFGSKTRDEKTMEAWWPLLYEYGVDMVFNGHAHYYVRSQPIRPVSGRPYGVRDNEKGVIQIISGGGGASLYQIESDHHNNSYFDQLFVYGEDQEHNFCEIRISGDTLFFQAKFPDGTVFDELQLYKPAKPDSTAPDPPQNVRVDQSEQNY